MRVRNLVDYFLKHTSVQSSKEDKPATILAKEHVNFVAAYSVPRAITVEEIKQVEDSDSQLQLVIKTLRRIGAPSIPRLTFSYLNKQHSCRAYLRGKTKEITYKV